MAFTTFMSQASHLFYRAAVKKSTLFYSELLLFYAVTYSFSKKVIAQYWSLGKWCMENSEEFIGKIVLLCHWERGNFHKAFERCIMFGSYQKSLCCIHLHLFTLAIIPSQLKLPKIVSPKQPQWFLQAKHLWVPLQWVVTRSTIEDNVWLHIKSKAPR